MKRSKITWCDYSGGNLNFVLGCTPESEGCQNCYARSLYERFGKNFSQVVMHPEKLARLAAMAWPQDGNVRGPGARPLLFACDMSDLFHEAVTDQFILNALDIMASMSHVDFLLLTKRAFRMAQIISTWAKQAEGRLPRNIWPGITAENGQRFADRWDHLADAPAMGCKWVSVEPMLEPMDMMFSEMREYGCALPDWIVCGAESGPNRRPFDKAWAVALKDQCDRFEIPFFFKQSSGLYPGMNPTLRGREWKAWPQ